MENGQGYILSEDIRWIENNEGTFYFVWESGKCVHKEPIVDITSSVIYKNTYCLWTGTFDYHLAYNDESPILQAAVAELYRTSTLEYDEID